MDIGGISLTMNIRTPFFLTRLKILVNPIFVSVVPHLIKIFQHKRRKIFEIFLYFFFFLKFKYDRESGRHGICHIPDIPGHCWNWYHSAQSFNKVWRHCYLFADIQVRCRNPMVWNKADSHNNVCTVTHHCDVIMTTIASQITSLTVVYSTVYSDADQRKHQSSASLAFVWGIHRERWIPRTNGQ